MQCCFCGKFAESVDEAIALGWYPDFWVGETSYQGPICPECRREHLLEDEDGEYVLKPDHLLPSPTTPKGKVRVARGKFKANLVVPPKFALGQVVATPGALEAIEASGQSAGYFLDRHIIGDWGEVNDEDKLANDQALVDGSRILSAYRTLRNERLWVITEAVGDDGKRGVTTILRPEEY